MGNFLQMSTYYIFATWLKSCTPLIRIGCPRNYHPLPPYHGWEVQHHLKNHLWLKQEFLIGRGPGYSWTQVDLFNGSVLCISWQSLARFFLVCAYQYSCCKQGTTSLPLSLWFFYPWRSFVIVLPTVHSVTKGVTSISVILNRVHEDVQSNQIRVSEVGVVADENSLPAGGRLDRMFWR